MSTYCQINRIVYSLPNRVKFNICFVYILFTITNFIPLFSQDYFGQLTFPASNQPQAIAIDKNENMFISLWSVGILKSTDFGLTYDRVNVGLKNKFVTDILPATDGTMYISTWEGGIYKSSDKGNLWTEINTGLTNLKINCLKETSNGAILAGSQGDGVFISTNKGTNWQNSISGLRYKAISTLEITKQGYFVAGTFGGGIFISKDIGKTWKSSNSGMKNMFITKFAKNNSGEIYAATNGGGVFVSITDGMNWKQIPEENLTDRYINTIISTEFSDRPIVVGSKTSGIQYYGFDIFDWLWTWRQPIISFGSCTGLAKDKNNRIFAVGTTKFLLMSTNFGKDWNEVGIIKEELPSQLTAFGNGKVLGKFSYNFDSTYFSSNYGKSWEATNLPIDFVDTTFYKEIDSIDKYVFQKRFVLYNSIITNENEIFVAGSQGLFHSLNGIDFSIVPGFDQKRVIGMDFKNGFLALYSDSIPLTPSAPLKQSILISTNNGNSFNQVTKPEGGYVPIIKIAENGNLFCGLPAKIGNIITINIYRSTNNGASWNQISINPNYGSIYSFDLNSKNYIYVGTENGVLISTNFGNTWDIKTIKFQNKDTANIIDINVSENDFIYVLCSFKANTGRVVYSVWMSRDNGNNWEPLWQNLNPSVNASLSADSDNNIYFLGNALYKHLDSTMLTTPNLILPLDKKEGLSLLLTMSWTTDKFAELYEVQISDRQDFMYLSDYSVQRDTLYTLTDSLAFNSDYYWRVRSKWHGTYNAWSEIRKFSTLLNPPLLISPPDKSTGVDFEPTLVWHKVKKAQIYELQVSENNQFTTLAFKKDSLTDSLLIKVPLKAEKSYFWRVRAKNESSISPWSEVWNFKTTFEAPILISPKNDSIDVPVKTNLVWGQVMNSNYYNILLSKKSDFSGETPTKVQNITEFSVNLDYDTKYYWKASVGNNLGESPYSPSWSFLTTIEPITLISPADKSLNQPLKANLQWEQNQKYKNYEILLSETNDFETSELDSILNKESVNTSKLKSYQKYFWKVKVKTNIRNGEWSEVRSFTTLVDLPMLRFPENNTTNHPNTLIFLWFPVDGAEYYFLQVSKDEEFNNLIISKDSIYAALFEIKEELLADTKYYWRVRASNSDGFSIWSEIWNFTTKVVSVKEEKETPFITPNPALDYIYVDWSFLRMQESAIQIFDIFGNEMQTTPALRATPKEEENQYRIDISTLHPGVYFVRIGNEKPIKFIKL